MNFLITTKSIIVSLYLHSSDLLPAIDYVIHKHKRDATTITPGLSFDCVINYFYNTLLPTGNLWLCVWFCMRVLGYFKTECIRRKGQNAIGPLSQLYNFTQHNKTPTQKGIIINRAPPLNKSCGDISLCNVTRDETYKKPFSASSAPMQQQPQQPLRYLWSRACLGIVLFNIMKMTMERVIAESRLDFLVKNRK